MKKWVSLLLALALACGMVSVAVGDNACDHLLVQVNTCYSPTYISSEYHGWAAYDVYYCDICGTYIEGDIYWPSEYLVERHEYWGDEKSADSDIWDEEFTYEEHRDMCSFCHYNRVTGTVWGVGAQSFPHRLRRQELVSGMGADLIGCTATVAEEYAELRSGPGTQYDKEGRAYRDETYVVEDFFDYERTTWLYVCTNGRNKFAWISAGMVDIDTEADLSRVSEYRTLYGTCTIINNGGALRQGPAADYPRIGSVYTSTTFWIEDIYVPETGRPWFKVTVDGVKGWISSGLTNKGPQ